MMDQAVMITIQYTVSGLPLCIPKPSLKNVPVTFTGINGHWYI